ncbi:hypothetical protein [uncultured Cohaesibacter sp.]|uniref:hypothetical protein n=1 Tax=uncultured Cohaesibacter sp. TaxID=1002546 RepID=UPI0029C99B65|nr:hypothetical protein [uncultured Cohaesibacter sp.]
MSEDERQTAVSRPAIRQVFVLLASAFLLGLSLLAVADVGNQLALKRLNDNLAPIADSYAKRLEGLVDLDLPFNQLGSVRGENSALSSLIDEALVIYKTDLAGASKSFALFVHRNNVSTRSLIGSTDIPYMLEERPVHDSLGESFATVGLARSIDDLVTNLDARRLFMIISLGAFTILSLIALAIARSSLAFSLLIIGYVATAAVLLTDYAEEFRDLSREAATQSANIFEQDLEKAFNVGLTLETLVGVEDYISDLRSAAPMIGEIALFTNEKSVYSTASNSDFLGMLSDRFFKVEQVIPGSLSRGSDLTLTVSGRSLPTLIDLSLLLVLALVLLVLTKAFEAAAMSRYMKKAPVDIDAAIALSLGFLLVTVEGQLVSGTLTGLAGAISPYPLALGLMVITLVGLALGFFISGRAAMILSLLALCALVWGTIADETLLTFAGGLILLGSLFQMISTRFRPFHVLATLVPAIFASLALALGWPFSIPIANLLLVAFATAGAMRIALKAETSKRERVSLPDAAEADHVSHLSRNWLWPVMAVMQATGFFMFALVALDGETSSTQPLEQILVFLTMLAVFYTGASLARSVPLGARMKWFLTLVCVLAAFAILSISILSERSLSPVILPVALLMGAARYWLASQPMLVQDQAHWSAFDVYTDLVPLLLALPLAFVAHATSFNLLFAAMVHAACLSPLAFATIAGSKASTGWTVFSRKRAEVSS